MSGQVVRAANNDPLKKAYVYLRKSGGRGQAEGYVAITDSEGHFSISGLPAGEYTLSVERAGYVPQSYGQGKFMRAGTPLVLAPGSSVHDLLFRMVATAVITGRISNEDGNPVAGARISVLRSAFRNGKRTVDEAGGARTNDRGEYRIWGLRGGSYFIRAVKEPLQYRAGSGTTGEGSADQPRSGYAPVYYPGTADLSHAGAVEVGPGQEVPAVDLILVPTRAVRVTGHVITFRPAEQLSGNVTLSSVDGAGIRDLTNMVVLGPKGGLFAFEAVVPGAYEVRAMIPHDGKTLVGTRRIEVGSADVEGVDLAPALGMEVRGQLRLESREKIDVSGMKVWLRPREEDYRTSAREDIQNNGTFVFHDVNEGSYDFEFGGTGPGVYLKDVRVGGANALESGITVGPSGIRGTLEVVLGGPTGEVEGEVTDEFGLPAPGAVAVLVPDGAMRTVYQFYRIASTDQQGKFAVRNVRPGDYKMFSWSDIEEGEWEDPEFLKRVEDKGVKVSVEENGRHTVSLKVIGAQAAGKAQ